MALWKAESTAAGEDSSDAIRKGIGLVACLLILIGKASAPTTLATGTQLAPTAGATMYTVTATIVVAAAHSPNIIHVATGVAARSRNSK